MRRGSLLGQGVSVNVAISLTSSDPALRDSAHGRVSSDPDDTNLILSEIRYLPPDPAPDPSVHEPTGAAGCRPTLVRLYHEHAVRVEDWRRGPDVLELHQKRK